MNRPGPDQIDAIVRAVLGELARLSGPNEPVDHVFSERLLSERHAAGIPEGTRELKVAPGTVVTPSARDLLKKKGIAVRLAASDAKSSPGRDGVWGFAIEAANDLGKTSSVRRRLVSDVRPWIEVGRSARDASEWASSADDRGVVLITDEASIAVWRAHRLDRVRAAAARDVVQVERAVRNLGMNMLVIESSDSSIHLMTRMCFAFRDSGRPRKPADLEGSGTAGGISSNGANHANRGSDRSSDLVSSAPESSRRAIGDRLAFAEGGDRRRFREKG